MRAGQAPAGSFLAHFVSEALNSPLTLAYPVITHTHYM